MGLRYYGKNIVFNVDEKRANALRRDSAGLTFAQRRMLVAIAELRVELDCCPTFREIASRCDLVFNTQIIDRVDRLVALGYVKRGGHADGRTIHPTDLGWRISGVDSGGLADPRVERPYRCSLCAAVTFKPHQPATCRQLLTGQTFAEQRP